MPQVLTTTRLELVLLEPEIARDLAAGINANGHPWARGYPMGSTLLHAELTAAAAAHGRPLGAFGTYQVVRRADNTVIGLPGTTPVKPGETIYVAATGFGPTDVPVVSGAITQSGTLPSPLPVVQIAGVTANVRFAGLVSPGTYIVTFDVPSTVPDGELALTATYKGSSIQPNLLITVQH